MAARPCCSRLVVTLKSLATSWPPLSDCPPKLSLRAITADLSDRTFEGQTASAVALLVGSTSGWARKVNSAVKFFSRARQVPSVLASGVVSPGLTPRSQGSSEVVPNPVAEQVLASAEAPIIP
jgi:hypothetical protein